MVFTDNALTSKYKSSYLSAGYDFFLHTFLVCSSYYYLWYFKDSYMSILTTILFSLLNIKTFIIFHDCGHDSYTPSKTLNRILGILIAPMVYFTESWKYTHNTHHLTNGRKNNTYDFAHNELIFFTLKQYKSMSTVYRQVIKTVFHPFNLFTVLTYFKFMVFHRFYAFCFLVEKYINSPPIVYLFAEQIFNNLGIAAMLYFQYKYSILNHCLMGTFISSTCGALLFFSQHTYNPPYIVDNEEWTLVDSGLKGSSYIEIPWYLKYFTGGIEYHHIHHYNSKIPNYNLKKVHDEVVSTSNMFDNIVKMSLIDCYKNLWLSLYDEDRGVYITFNDGEKEIEKEL